MILWLLGCAAAPSSVLEIVAAHHAVAEDPRRWADCVPLTHAWHQADCLTMSATGIAPKRPDDALEVCAKIPEGILRDDCAFQVAETVKDSERCASAGLYAQPCRTQLWIQSVPEQFPAGIGVAEAQARAEARIPAYGLAGDDRIVWFGVFEQVYAGAGPIDRGACAEARTARRQELCEETALHAYRQRLDRANRRGELPCPGTPLAPEVDPGADPTLMDAYLRRAKGMNCPEVTRPGPPGEASPRGVPG